MGRVTYNCKMNPAANIIVEPKRKKKKKKMGRLVYALSGPAFRWTRSLAITSSNSSEISLSGRAASAKGKKINSVLHVVCGKKERKPLKF